MDAEDLKFEFDEAVRERRRPSYAESVQAYMREALDAELDALRRESKPPEPPLELLVAMCGTSPQPILLSTRFLDPKRVLLVGTDTDEGRTTVAELRPHVPSAAELRPVEIDASDPMKAFATLQARVRALIEEHGLAPEHVGVDITGGKKTMVVASFLLASQLGLRIFYVDGEYNAVVGLPEPCSGKLRELRDPTVGLRLSEVQRARELYEHGRFAQAASLFEGAAEALEALRDYPDAPFAPDALRRAAVLSRAMQAWSESRYPDAARAFGEAGIEPPSSVAELAAAWPNPDQTKRLRRFAKSRREDFVRFVADRLGWAHAYRAQNDERAALLQAYSACEVAKDGLIVALLADKDWVVTTDKNAREAAHVRKALADRKEPDALIAEALAQGGSIDAERIAPLEVRPSVIGIGGAIHEIFGDEIREHRNAIVHKIEDFDGKVVAKLLDGSPSPAEALIRGVAAALRRGAGLDELVERTLAEPRPIPLPL